MTIDERKYDYPHMEQRPSTNIIHIHEILLNFVSHCDKPTLARLARTCKAISDPALDVLWEELESFAHLLRIFPKELVSWSASETASARPVSILPALVE